jgi:hypothetical protein
MRWHLGGDQPNIAIIWLSVQSAYATTSAHALATPWQLFLGSFTPARTAYFLNFAAMLPCAHVFSIRGGTRRSRGLPSPCRAWPDRRIVVHFEVIFIDYSAVPTRDCPPVTARAFVAAFDDLARQLRKRLLAALRQPRLDQPGALEPINPVARNATGRGSEQVFGYSQTKCITIRLSTIPFSSRCRF